jgi:hypothetical protein
MTALCRLGSRAALTVFHPFSLLFERLRREFLLGFTREEIYEQQVGWVAMGEHAGTGSWISDAGIAPDAIRKELARILASNVFVQSDRLGQFLRYTVETTLAGEAETLKEYRIGTEVYNRRPPYHPSSDSIVRSEARRLRKKLKEYYESSGMGDPVFIYYRPGSYVPVFRRGEGQKSLVSATEFAFRELLAKGAVANAIEISSGSRVLNLQIVFEGTVRISHSGTDSAEPTKVGAWPKRSKRIQFREAFGMPATKAN